MTNFGRPSFAGSHAGSSYGGMHEQSGLFGAGPRKPFRNPNDLAAFGSEITEPGSESWSAEKG